jgi:hypothetical protein
MCMKDRLFEFKIVTRDLWELRTTMLNTCLGEIGEP